MSKITNDPLMQVKTTRGSLLYELQIISDEIGETETDRDKMLLEIERECLEVYRRSVDQANKCKAQLRQAIADSEAEQLAAICSAMGERPVHTRQNDRLKHVLKLLSTSNLLCSVLGLDFQQIANEIHASLGNNSEETINISNDTIESLTIVIKKLLELKLLRLQRLQDLATSMLELWNLDIPIEEQQMFEHDF